MKIIYLLIDIIFLPWVLLLSFIFYLVRLIGEEKLVISNKILLAKGILPTRKYFDKTTG